MAVKECFFTWILSHVYVSQRETPFFGHLSTHSPRRWMFVRPLTARRRYAYDYRRGSPSGSQRCAERTQVLKTNCQVCVYMQQEHRLEIRHARVQSSRRPDTRRLSTRRAPDFLRVFSATFRCSSWLLSELFERVVCSSGSPMCQFCVESYTGEC